MSKVIMRYTSHLSRSIIGYFPIVASFCLCLLFALSVIRYVSETQQTEHGKTFHIARLTKSLKQ